MAFGLFIALNAVLLIRPEELMPDIEGLRLYLILIALSTVTSLGRLTQQLNPADLHRNPITVCVLALIASLAVSCTFPVGIEFAIDQVPEFCKVVLYYLLIVAVVNTPARFRAFLTWLVLFSFVLTLLGMLQFYEIIDVEALAQAVQGDVDPETGDPIFYTRLCSSGIFNDPNDLCLVINMGILICLYRATSRPVRPTVVVWAALAVFFGVALSLTRSRGGFLAALAGPVVLFHARYGWRKAAPLILAFLPGMFWAFGGRQTDIGAGDNDTSQQRLQLWSDGLAAFPSSPLWGIGYGEYYERFRLVAHNSYVQSFVELGVIGGTLFAGAYYLAVAGLYRLKAEPDSTGDPEFVRARPYVLGAIVAYAVGMFSISRNFNVPTYLTLGLAAAYLRIAIPAGETREWYCLNSATIKRVVFASAAVLLFHKVFVMVFVHY
jgi:O-antigen ligase